MNPNTRSQAINEIVIVGQNKTEPELLSTMLHNAGYIVRTAVAEELMLQLKKKKFPALLLLTGNIDAADHTAFCRQLKTDELTRNIPVISVIESADVSGRIHAFQYGAADVITKPLIEVEVIARVKTQLELCRLQKSREKKLKNNQNILAEQGKAEDKLMSSEQRFRSFVENANDIVFSLTPAGALVYASPNWKQVLGHDPNEFIGPNALQHLLHPEDLQGGLAAIEKVLRTGEKQVGIEYRVRHMNGSWRWHSVNASPIFDTKGNIVSLLGIARDITNQKNIEDELRKSEEKYRRLVENAIDIIFTLDKELNVVDINMAGVKVLGYEREEVIGKSSKLFINEADVVLSKAMLEKKMLGQKQTLYEIFLIAKDGRKIAMEVQTSLLYKDDEFSGVQGIARDITDWKKAEKELRRSQQENLAVVNAFPHIIFRITRDGQLVDYRSPKNALLFFEAEKLPGKNFREIMPVNFVDLISDTVEVAYMLNEVRTAEYSLMQPTGKTFFEVRAIPLSSEEMLLFVLDITQRKQMEEEIIRQKHFFEQIFSQSSISTQILDKDGWCERINPKLSELFGVKPENIEGKKYNIFKDDALLKSGVMPQLEQVFTARKTAEWELLFDIGMAAESQQVEVKEKKKVWFQNWAYPVTDENGQLTNVIIQHSDISARKLAEEAIIESEEKYRSLIEQASDAIIIYSLDGTIYEFNETACKQAGYTREEFKQLKISDFLFDENLILDQAATERMLNGETILFERKLKRKDGNSVTSELNVRLLSGGRILAFIRDISERREAERRIQESEEKYRQLFEKSPMPVWLYDTGTLFILDVNEAAIKHYGYSKEEFLKMKISDLRPAAEVGKLMNYLNDQPAGLVHTGPWKHQKKDGTLIDVEINSHDFESGKRNSRIVLLNDVTEKLKVQQALTNSEEKYRHMIERNQAGIYQTNINGTILQCNEAFARILGYDSPAEILFKKASSFYFSETDRLEFVEMVHRSKDLNNYEIKLKHKDGHPVYLLENCYLQKDPNGDDELIEGTVIDITDRKKQEKIISDYKFALDVSSIVDVSDKEGIIQYVNENFCLISGYKKEEIIGKDHRMLSSGYHSKKFIKNLWDTITRGKVWHKEVRNKRKDGTFFWVDTTIVPLLDSDGKPFQFITIRADVTKRKEAELNMEKAIERYEIVSKATSDTIYDWDARQDRIVFNEGLKNVFGYAQEEYYGVADWRATHIHPDDLLRISAMMTDILEQKSKVIQFEYRFLCANGFYKTILDRAYIIFDEQGNMQRMIGAIQDLTYQKEEEKRIDKAVIDAQEEERNQIGMELHDNVNQILTAASLYLGLEKDMRKREDIISEPLEKSSAYIKDAIQEIRALSHRLSPGSIKEVSLKGIFESLILSMNLDKQIKVNLRFDKFDRNQISDDIQISLYRIMQEQMTNILKHAGASEVEINLMLTDQSVILMITDNGKGFNPYAVKSGIGLKNIYKRVEYFSGELTINSSPGKGCELIVQIPLSQHS